MLKDKMAKALNQQINAEYYSAYLYYSMAYWFDDQGLGGFAKWMRVQALEEITHGQKIAGYIADRGGRVLVEQIDGPPTEWGSPLAVFENAAEHERHVSDLIHELVDLAAELRDHATSNFLQWFVAEQVEEEATADEAVGKLKLITESKGGNLYMLDREFGSRSFGMPPDMPDTV